MPTKISINRANKLRNTLEAIQVSFDTTVALRNDLDKNDAQAIFFKSVDELYTNFFGYVKSTKFIYALRTSIHEANEHCGITPVIAKIAMLEGLLKIYKSTQDNIIRQEARASQLADFFAAVDHRNRLLELDASKATAASRVSVNIGESLKEEIRKVIAATKLEIQDLQEERNTLNHKNTIELSDDFVEFLKLNSLM